ncbi:hypothetical protein HU751_023045 [Pseudomonas sp. BW13M1]|uniref:Uncharacterized protein n=1 Tax=Pseudomonas peradeniyensis TaxID=2745488 RepID=A0A923K1Q8_9PSED|nr:hypothetical protein [Pseudomonas peradeniyensis]MBV4507712.1 hypothetical protein [Pseudomonas peradeniyensis]
MSIHDMTDDMKSEFLTAFRAEFGFGEMTATANDDAAAMLKAAAWAWQASRSTVVVELPSACAYEGLTEHLGSVIELAYEAPEHDPVGLARIPDVRAAIEAAGLKVAP